MTSKNECTLTELELQVIQGIRNRGFAVITITPDELNGIIPTVAEILIPEFIKKRNHN